MITFNQITEDQNQDYVVVQAKEQKVEKDSFTSSKSGRDEFGRTISGKALAENNMLTDKL